MSEVNIVGVDLAKRVFQVHGATSNGMVVFRKKLNRAQFLPFLEKLPVCVVAMEACATSHYWGREIAKLGHRVRLIAPIYVKPFVKRQKNDAADAEAIVEAASRPTMRFVEVKTEEQQASAMVFRARDLLIRQRTQVINALRGHMAEYGIIAGKGAIHLKQLRDLICSQSTDLPGPVSDVAFIYLDQINDCSAKIAVLEKTVRARSSMTEKAQLLQTMPGIGPVGATAIEAFAPPMKEFRRGRDFAAWLGLVPRQQSSGGKQILGKTSKMGQRDIRRLLIIGAMSSIRAALRNGPQEGTWLARMLARKPRLVVAIALANKMARGIWAMLMKGEGYQDPKVAA